MTPLILPACIAALALGGAWHAAAQADEPQGDEAQPPRTKTALEAVVVTATRTERLPLDVPASVDVVGRESIRDGQLRLNLSESLPAVPGVVVLNRQNYAQDLQISIRGFGSRSTFGVRGVRLYVDGVPATTPDGQGQVSNFPLNAAESIEVLRGPFSALYGNSSGGVIALTTELWPQPHRFEVSAAAGSFGTWRAGGSAAGGQGSYAYALDVGRFATEGARSHSAARRDLLNLRAGLRDTPLGAVRLTLNALDLPDAQDPLGLTRAQVEADPMQAAPAALAFDTRKSVRQATLGVELRSPLAQGLALTTALWLGSRDVRQYQAIPVAAQSDPRSPGGVIDLDRTFGGADMRLTIDHAPLTTTAGIAVERLHEQRRGFENFSGTGASQVLGVQGALRRDETNRIASADLYAQTEARLGGRWRLHAGVRGSEVRFRSRDRYIVGSNGDDSGSRAFSAFNPTLGAVFRLRPDASLYAAYGRGFETPTLNELAYRSDGSAGFNDALRPARSDNVEIGLKWVQRTGLAATVAAFSVRTRDEIVVQTNVGGRASFGNATRTQRQGVEASVRWRPRPAMDLQAAVSATGARFGAGFLTCGPAPCSAPTIPAPAGNRLPGVPSYSLFARAAFEPAWGSLALEWQARSALVVDDRNTDRAAGFGVVNAVLARSLGSVGAAPRAFLRVDNVADRASIGSVIVNEGSQRFFEPAPGRIVLVGLDWPL